MENTGNIKGAELKEYYIARAKEYGVELPEDVLCALEQGDTEPLNIFIEKARGQSAGYGELADEELDNVSGGCRSDETKIYPPLPPRPGYFDYLIVRGDTLGELAERYGTTVQTLVEANNIPNKNRIYAGHRLYIPIK